MNDPNAAFSEPSTTAASRSASAVEGRLGSAFWRRFFGFYDTLLESVPYQRMVARNGELLAPAPGDEILDAGTGTGNVALDLLGRGARVVGIDYFESALEICRAKAPAAEFRFGDLTGRLDFPDDRFDHVACVNVIYTLAPADQPHAVRELCRVLKPGGRAAITVFGAGFKALKVYRETLAQRQRTAGWFDTIGFALRYLVNTVRILSYVARIKRQQRSGQYTFFSRDQLERLLTEGGFVVEGIEPAFAGQCWIALATKPRNGSAK
ncbi:MAG TPA: class I SAM-dependent methyltransferase [Thermoanaerobaculia bacterium]|jgi:ubiquinone/menaquinone biosynthesis C-methylase UbiE|nr:class I SAM-dependent methyltransferase [Thermoanaerobaculia bacterium]